MNTNNPRGPGRKPTPTHLKRVSLNYRVPKWVSDALNELDGKNGELVEAALIKQYNLKPPK